MEPTSKKGKFLSTEQISPKIVEETVPFADDDSIESLNSYQYSENSESLIGLISPLEFSDINTIEN